MCLVPIPSNRGAKEEDNQNSVSAAAAPSSSSGNANAITYYDQYELVDEAADVIGPCATRRLIALHPDHCLKLLRDFSLTLSSCDGDKSEIVHQHQDEHMLVSNEWLDRWGKYSFADAVVNWEPGAVIVTTYLLAPPDTACDGGGVVMGNIFLSCALRRPHQYDENRGNEGEESVPPQQSVCLVLLSDERIATSWIRILEHSRKT